MNVVLPLLVVLPLFGAGLSMAVWRSVRIQQVIGVVVLAVCLALAVLVAVEVSGNGPFAVDLGGWPAPLALTLHPRNVPVYSPSRRLL